jgi:putative transposase
MPNYRRAFLLGGCWFFTVNLLDRRQSLLVDHIDDLRSAFAATRKNYPFDIVAIVVLPDHLHAVWTLPPDDAQRFWEHLIRDDADYERHVAYCYRNGGLKRTRPTRFSLFPNCATLDVNEEVRPWPRAR